MDYKSFSRRLFERSEPAQNFALIGMGGKTVDGFHFGSDGNDLTEHFYFVHAAMQRSTARSFRLKPTSNTVVLGSGNRRFK